MGSSHHLDQRWNTNLYTTTIIWRSPRKGQDLWFTSDFQASILLPYYIQIIEFYWVNAVQSTLQLAGTLRGVRDLSIIRGSRLVRGMISWRLDNIWSSLDRSFLILGVLSHCIVLVLVGARSLLVGNGLSHGDSSSIACYWSRAFHRHVFNGFTKSLLKVIRRSHWIHAYGTPSIGGWGQSTPGGKHQPPFLSSTSYPFVPICKTYL